MIYFDHNATTPTDERVLEAMLPFLKSFYGNPSSLYRLGRLTRSAIDRAREQVASLVQCSASEIIFTSGGTEANNLALTALAPNKPFAVSAIEHPSILEPARRLNNQGHHLTIIEVNNNGLITQDTIDSLIQQQPALISIMSANNETGVLQNIDGFSQQLREKGIIVHTDAVQALGKIPINFNETAAHLMSLSSHKIYGPKGCGALLIDKTVQLKPLFLGGAQEQGLRSGTENVAAIVGFGKAAELAQAELVERSKSLFALRQLLEDGLNSIRGLIIFGHNEKRLPNTIQFGLPEIDGEMLLMALDKKGIAVSSASACASAGGKPSSVLTAMGIDETLAKSAIRVSLGKSNSETDVYDFINQLKTFVY
jgi:cysteine desulfurase